MAVEQFLELMTLEHCLGQIIFTTNVIKTIPWTTEHYLKGKAQYS
jgi:hypothetical protein